MADDLDARRALLEKRLAEHKAKTVESAQQSGGNNKAGMGQAIKISSEFIAGVVVGAGLGWGIDQLAGTSPFGMIVLLFLGFGAGILNVLRSAGVVAPQSLDDK